MSMERGQLGLGEKHLEVIQEVLINAAGLTVSEQKPGHAAHFLK